MKTYGGMDESYHTFLTLAVEAGENPLYRRLFEPQSQSKRSGEKKNLLPCHESNCVHSCPANSQSLY
jgi:hypothetical protein